MHSKFSFAGHFIIGILCSSTFACVIQMVIIESIAHAGTSILTTFVLTAFFFGLGICRIWMSQLESINNGKNKIKNTGRTDLGKG